MWSNSTFTGTCLVLHSQYNSLPCYWNNFLLVDGDLSINKLLFIQSRAYNKDSASLIASGPRAHIHFWNVFQGGTLMAQFPGVGGHHKSATFILFSFTHHTLSQYLSKKNSVACWWIFLVHNEGSHDQHHGHHRHRGGQRGRYHADRRRQLWLHLPVWHLWLLSDGRRRRPPRVFVSVINGVLGFDLHMYLDGIHVLAYSLWDEFCFNVNKHMIKE